MDQFLGVLWDAAKDLFSCAKVQGAYICKLEENLTSFQDKWNQLENSRKDVQTRIEAAETMGEMQRTNEVNGWLQRVQNLQQEMEEITVSQEIHDKCLSGCCPKNCASRYKLGRKVVRIIPRIDELLTARKGFDPNVDITYKLAFRLIDEMPCVETVGLELMLSKVQNSFEDENASIIGLYGMGGAGKTTLMKRIHNEWGKRRDKFDLVLWVVVSRDCDNSKVMNDIRKKLRVEDDFWNTSNEDEKQSKIYQILKQKRFLLMLDDIWRKLELERVGVPNPKEISCQSKIMFTTRFEDVCDKMQAKKLKVECLLEKEAFDLFCKNVGEETLKCHREIPEIAREIAKECAGLPLALVAVGSAMAGVKSIEAWRQAKSDLRSSPWTASDLEDKVFLILMFSYDRLPDEAHKSCFLYCALYPEDYEIEVEELIDRWIGEGFLGKGKYMTKSIYDMREEGQSIIEKLKLSSLLEDATDLGFPWPPQIKMHDVIRDMALWLVRDQDRNKDKVVVDGEALVMDFERSNVVERISIIDVTWTWQVPICPNLLTLCVNTRMGKISNLQYMIRLKVLDLSDTPQTVPIEIGNLINLEFLHLSSTILRLPIELKNLKKLRVFLIEDIEGLIPLEVFESLERLQVFRYSGLIVAKEEEEILLDKLGSLPDLEEVGVDLNTMASINKLLNQNKLHGCLRKFSLTGIEEQLEMVSLLSSWSTMKHLEIIVLSELDDIKEVSSITHSWHLDKLRVVRITECNSISHLTWLKYAPLLEVLIVGDCESLEEVVKGGQDEEATIDLFSNLGILVLGDLPKMKSIYRRALPFPSLKYNIWIESCDNLRKLPLDSNSAKNAMLGIVGEPQWWSNLEWEDIATEDLFHSRFQDADKVLKSLAFDEDRHKPYASL